MHPREKGGIDIDKTVYVQEFFNYTLGSYTGMDCVGTPDFCSCFLIKKFLYSSCFHDRTLIHQITIRNLIKMGESL